MVIELQEVRQKFAETKSRHNDLCELEDDLEQLRDMFLDLSYLLSTQV
jgi:t-SNARE complex subunit (syntaxin)